MVNKKVAGARKMGAKPQSPRKGTKVATILQLISRPGGATLKELIGATGWEANSVRGFISFASSKGLVTRVESFLDRGGLRSYRAL